MSIFGERGASRDLGPPTPGEVLYHALGRCYWRWRSGRPVAHPKDVDVEEAAWDAGVWYAVEFVQEIRGRLHYHFPNEVLIVDDELEFPWRLLRLWEWAGEQEYDEFEEECGG